MKMHNKGVFSSNSFYSSPKSLALDQNALHGLAGKVVNLATRNSEADPAAVLATFLTRFGVEVGPRPVLMVGDTKHYPRIFVVGVQIHT